MPKSYEYTFGIQRNIGFNTVLEIRYVGSRSDELIGALDLNEVNLPAAFMDDFRRAQQNCRLQGALQPGGSTAFDPAFLCTNAGFNANIPGSQQLAFFDQNISGGFLTNSTVRSFIQQGRPGSLAQFYIQNGVQGAGAGFQNTSEIYTAGVLTNVGKYRYDALQAEVRRRFSNGLSFQANYAFAKVLTDIPTDDQNRYSFFQDQDNPGLNYGRADYDRTHTFNFNAVYELPFGKGKKFLNQGGWVNAVFGGFQISSIVQISSGYPVTILDPRSTASTTFKASRQPASTTLSREELKNITGIFDTPNGRFFIDPKVLLATASNGVTSQRVDLTQPLPAGFTLVSVRAASPINQAPFEGQVFFFNKTGETGNIPRNLLNGTPYYNWDAGISKNFRITETSRLQIRAEVFNVLNSRVPFFGAQNSGENFDISSTNFGRSTAYYPPRIIQFGIRYDF
jgi:hypothetical protein